jgi:NAD(P)-dependent dehydrogenase (short-subunit alcohol dehydrogenase family)
MTLTDTKTVIIVGAAGLIGRSVARALLNAGCRLVLVDKAEELPLIAESISNEAIAYDIDILERHAFSELMADLESKNITITAAVNCAYPKNKNYGRSLEDVELSDFQSNLSMHVGAFFEVMKVLSEYMLRHEILGSVVNLASIYGVITPRFEIYKGTNMTTPVEYVAIKSAIINLTRYFAKYYQGSGIRFNCISPGGIFDGQDKNFVQAYENFCGRWGLLDSTDLCGAIGFLLSDQSKYINGQNLIVDDGFSL